MKSEDDPEARIRELEQPLADTARTSEAAESQPPSKWAAPSAPAFQASPLPYSDSQSPPLPYSDSQPPPLPYSGSQFGQSLQTSSRNRTWWIVAAVFVIGMIALPAGIMLFTAHQASRSGLHNLVPTPSMSPDSPAPSGGLTPTPAAGPSTPPAAIPAAPSSENLTVSGINENRTMVCNQSLHEPFGVRRAEQGDGRERRQHRRVRLQQSGHLPQRCPADRPIRSRERRQPRLIFIRPATGTAR
jgi:hypothetical protein